MILGICVHKDREEYEGLNELFDGIVSCSGMRTISVGIVGLGLFDLVSFQRKLLVFFLTLGVLRG
jgi:hypothetical protein